MNQSEFNLNVSLTASAPTGDMVMGEDPTVRRLEERVAGILGKEEGMFVPTGTWVGRVDNRAEFSGPGFSNLSFCK